MNTAPPAAPDDGLGDLRGRAATAFAWTFTEKWGARVASFAILLVLTRLLLPADFGVVALATAVIGLVTLVSEGGFGRALVQQQDATEKHRGAALLITAGLGLATAVGTGLASVPLASLLHNPEAASVLRWLSPAIALNCLAITPTALLERDLRFSALAKRRLASTVLGGGAGIGTALAGLGPMALVAQAVTASVVVCVLSWTAVHWRPTLRTDRNALADLWRVGSRIVLTEIVGFLNSQGDRLVIGAALGAVTLGHYYLGAQLVTIMIDMLATVFAAVALSLFAKLRSDPPRLRRWFLQLLAVTGYTAFPVFALMACAAPDLMPLVFGSKWSDSILIFQILCVYGAVTAVLYFDRSLLVAVGRSGAALAMTTIQAAFFLVTLLVAVQGGVLAVAVAMSVRQIVFLPVRQGFLRRCAGIAWRPYLAALLPPLATAAVGVAVMLGLRHLLVVVDCPVLPRLAAMGLAWLVVTTLACRLLSAPLMAKAVAALPARVPTGGLVTLLRLRPR